MFRSCDQSARAPECEKNDRFRGRLEHVHRRPQAGMSAIDNHADPLHFGHKQEAKPAEAGVGAFGAAIANMVLLIICHQRMADPEFVI